MTTQSHWRTRTVLVYTAHKRSVIIDKMLRFVALVAIVTIAAANESTCGPTRPSPVRFCNVPDMGSCGNACCIADIDVAVSPDDVYKTTKAWLAKGGTDGSFTYVTGPNKAGEDPSDDLRPYNLTWQYIYQGTHTTTKGYVDTININIQKGEDGGSKLRIANLANIHGALGDNGQSYKTIHYILTAIYPTVMDGFKVVFGCKA
eukprot:m.389361 g.389361  ORF g.389361 m.389361 type:complete len:203 (-) comp28293_c1_seq5:2039-2647(-)